MRDAGYDDVERGEHGSSEEHLTVTQFKVQQEQARLAELTEQNRQQVLCPILRDNTLCFIWCLSGTVRHDNYYG